VASSLAMLGSVTLILSICLVLANKSQVTFDDRIVLSAFISLLGLLLIELGNGASPAMSERQRVGSFD
jgi:hypothetical protein